MRGSRFILFFGGLLGSASGGVTLLTAPGLSWTSDTTDNTPDLSVTFPDILVTGTDVTFEYANNSGFSGATSVVHDLTGPESLAQAMTLALSALADGTWYVRVKYDGSAWSNTETKTIVSGPVATATFTMTQLAAAKRNYQRDTLTGGGQNKGQGRIPVTISSATAGTVYARVRSSDTTTILQAAWLVGSITNGQTLLSVTGVDARLGWFYLDLLDVSGSWKLGTVLVGMGANTFLWGQSLAAAMYVKRAGQGSIASASVTVDANTVVYATAPDGDGSGGALVTTAAWETPADAGRYSSAGAAQYLAVQCAAEGVNCGLVGHAKGSTTAASYFGSGAQASALQAIQAAVGGYERVMFLIGHSDAASNTCGINYRSHVFQVMEYLYQNNGKTVKTFTTLGLAIPNETSGGTWGSSAQQNVIRSAAWEVGEYDATRWQGSSANRTIYKTDIDLADGVHQSQAGSKQIADYMQAAATGTDETGTAGALARSKIDLTMVSPTYGAAKFGNGITAGQGYFDGNTYSPIPAVMCIATWFKFTALPSARGIFSHSQAGWYSYIDDDGTVTLAEPVGGAIGTYAGAALCDSNWHYLVTKMLANGDRELWIDGVRRINGNRAVPANDFGDFVVAAWDTGTTWRLTAVGGQLDEVLIYCYDVDASVVPTAAAAGTEAGLIHYWPLNSSGTSGLA